MYALGPRDHLVGQEAESRHRELAVAEFKELLQRGPENVHDHGVVIALDALPVHVGDTGVALEVVVDLCFV